MNNCINQKNITPLSKGGLIINSSIGNIQYGIPPETVKDSMSMGTAVPEYYIIPMLRFDWNEGISLMEFEFPAYYNFFLRKQNKIKVICDSKVKVQIESIF